MKIVLVNPPQVFSPFQTGTGVAPPLGLAYLAAVARRDGHQVTIIDAIAEGYKKTTRIGEGVAIRGQLPVEVARQVPIDVDLVGVSNHFSYAGPIVHWLCRLLKERTGAPIVLGGANATATAGDLLRDESIDFVILSEGEETFLGLCKHLERNASLDELDGIAYKDQDGKIIIRPKRRFIEKLDALPFPARDLLPMEKYHEARESHGATNDKWTSIVSSRGCTFECSFCTSALWNRTWRGRSPGNVVDEIEHCMVNFGIKEFLFEDENLTLNKARMIDICKEIINRGLKITWQTPNGIRATTIDDEMLRYMRASGCAHVAVAPESGSPRVLDDIIHKKQSLARVYRVVKKAARLGIKTAAFFVVGLPGETKQDMGLTLAFSLALAKVGLDEVIYSTFIPFPGSTLHQQLVKEGKLKTSNDDLIAVEHFERSYSFNDAIPGRFITRFKTRALILFHFVKFLYHPGKFLEFIANIATGRETTKTERFVRVFLRRVTGGLWYS